MGNYRLNGFIGGCLSLLLAACGGSSGSSGTGFSPPPPPPPPPPPTTATIDTQQVFPNLTFSQPVSLQQAPGDSTRWFVVEQAGRILEFANDQAANATSTFLDISGIVQSGGERGLLGMAFDPLFPVIGDVYVSYTFNDPVLGLVSVLSRFALLANGQALDPASEQVLLVVEQDFTNHNGGNIVFGPDDYLYLGLGDGGSGNDPNNRAQTTTNLLGSMIRLDIDLGVPYAIPAGNAFPASNAPCPTGVALGGEDCPEIYAWGLRNPWRFSFDRDTGDLWVGDVGQGDWEEINRVSAGDNLGWRVREGAHCNTNISATCDTNFVDPVTEYDRSLGASVTGGFVYRGTAIPDLVGWYVFGDFVSGRIFAIPADTPTFTTPTELLDSGHSIASFGEGEDGELYVVDYGGTIHRIVDAP